MSKILITGASGFVGSFLVDEALERGLEVYAGIRQSSSRKWLKDPRIKFVELDFSNFDQLLQTIRAHQFEYIIHNAGLTKANSASELFRVNAEYSFSFAKASMESQNLKKFTFMSSLAAYGTADYQKDGVVSNSSTPYPITSYGKSKLRAEILLQELTQLPLLVFRPTGVFGPRETDFLNLFSGIKKGIALQIGMTEQNISLVYIKDLVRVIMDGTLSVQTNKSYFVSDGNLYKGSYLNNVIATSLSKSPFTIKVPIPIVSVIAALTDFSSKLSGKPNILSRDKLPELKSRNMDCDIAPLVIDFDYKPLYSLQEAINETAQWYLENKWL
jgi:nucleoside-diphosphate-sugar epimerase